MCAHGICEGWVEVCVRLRFGQALLVLGGSHCTKVSKFLTHTSSYKFNAYRGIKSEPRSSRSSSPPWGEEPRVSGDATRSPLARRVVVICCASSASLPRNQIRLDRFDLCAVSGWRSEDGCADKRRQCALDLTSGVHLSQDVSYGRRQACGWQL